MRTCSTDDCGNEAWHGGLCHRCVKRRQRGLALRSEVQEHAKTPWQSLLNAVQAFADASAEAPEGDARAAWKRIQGRLRKALDRYNARMRTRTRRPSKDTVHP